MICAGLLAALTACSAPPARSAATLPPLPTVATGPTTTTPTTTPTTTVRPAETHAVRPAAGYRDTTPPPAIHATGTGYPAIARSLLLYRDWLYVHHPDPALAGNVYQQGTLAYQDAVTDLANVRAKHQTVVSIDQRWKFTVVSVLATLMTMRVHETMVENRWLDRDHRIVRAESYPEPNDYVVVMTKDGAGRWRVADVTWVARHPSILLSP